MHEASIAQHIIEDIERRIEAGDIKGRIRTIHMSVGRLTTIAPENLQFLFEVLSADSILAGSQLAVEHVPLRLKCAACRAEYEMENVDFRCIYCESHDVDILTGRELIIESVEVE
ncbi:MAG: hydrogenase maturation nickel metallochaperone HypA [Candidatus Latescibacterota bacterium]